MKDSFNPEYTVIKARLNGYAEDGEDEKIIEGYYMPKIKIFENGEKAQVDYVCDKNETENPQWYEINSYTICRNTGLKDKNSKFMFEYDLVKLYLNGQFEGYAYIEFSEFYQGFIARTNSGGFYYMNCGKSFEIIGNVVLNDEDYEFFEGQNIDKTFIDNSRCTRISKPKW